MTWSTAELEYEGLPLLLRKPDHENLRQFKEKLPILLVVEQSLSKVNKNGLPKKDYHLSLSAFDEYMCDLFPDSGNGIILFIETFNGKRSYYYYCKREFDPAALQEAITAQYEVTINVMVQEDNDWIFLENYPIRID